MSMWAYQTSSNDCCAKPRIAVRYPSAAASTILRRSLAPNPLSRPATARLAASRLTSHSNGPGSVSSKSLTSKTRRRSGEANAPKFDKCASPHNCTRSPDVGVFAQIRRHRQRRPAVERERRDQHSPMPDRYQLRNPRCRLGQQQPDRIPRHVRHELRMRLQRRHRPRILAPRHPIRTTQLLHCPSPRRTLGGCPRTSPLCRMSVRLHRHADLRAAAARRRPPSCTTASAAGADAR